MHLAYTPSRPLAAITGGRIEFFLFIPSASLFFSLPLGTTVPRFRKPILGLLKEDEVARDVERCSQSSLVLACSPFPDAGALTTERSLLFFRRSWERTGFYPTS